MLDPKEPGAGTISGSKNLSGANDGEFQEAISKSTPASSSYEPVEQYLKDIRRPKLLSKEEEVYYARLTQKGDAAARAVMIESNLRLVVKIAKRYQRSGMALADLIEEGNLGLMHAVEKFDPEKGFRYSTYGAWWIQQTIERAIMNQSRVVRLPVHIVKQLNTCLRTQRKLSHSNGTDPSHKDIAAALEKPDHEISKLMALNEKALSMDHSVSMEVDKPLLDTLKSAVSYEPLAQSNTDELKHKIADWLYNLPPKSREVIAHRFGLLGHDICTLDETGQQIGLTRERVRQIQSEALKRLKRIIESQGNTKDTLLG